MCTEQRAWRDLLGLVLVAAAILGLTARAGAQGTRSDYRRSANVRSLTREKVFRHSIRAKWSKDCSHLWYRVQTARDRHEFVLVDTIKGVRRLAFDHARLAKAMTEAGIKNARADRLPITEFTPAADGQKVSIRVGGTWWKCDLKTYKLGKLSSGKPRSKAEKLKPVADGPRVSPGRTTDTEVRFVNATKGKVEIVWLDTRGRRRSYGKLAAGATRDQHTYAGHVWLVLDAKGKPIGLHQARRQRTLVEIVDAKGKQPPGPPQPKRLRSRKRTEPAAQPTEKRKEDKTKWTPHIRDYNVYLRPEGGGEDIRLTADGTESSGYRGGFHWSPDRKKFVALRVQPGQERNVHLIESSPRDQVQPKLHSNNYLKPGDRVTVSKPHLFDLAAKKEIPISDALFPNPYRLGSIRWSADSRWFTFIYNQRGHQALRLLAVDATDGKVRPIIDDTFKTFVHYSGKMYLRWLDKTGEIIWMSERDGWNHLYLIDADTGKVKNQITTGPWVVRGVDRLDVEKRQVWFRAGGIRSGQDPYYIHYARVNFDGTGLTVLTAGDGTHEIEYSPDRKLFLDRYSRVDMPAVTELRRTSDGKLVCELERGDMSALQDIGWKPPIRFVAKGRDGKTDIYGVIYRPMKFDPKKKYPVIESIYAGPQGAYVPKSFRTSYNTQVMAELGFVVVQIDGMGTNYRSKKFHDVCWRNLADAGLPDRVLWIKAAAKKHPYMDATRVGIYGGSAGGQNAAAAVMTHGDFYKVAVADCGCHDNRMDKIWWNEQWMGYPVGPWYAANSNVTLAKGLTGKLLLIVGELDRNVDPASTMQVVHALIKADKDFDMLVIPGAGHGAAGSRYGRRRMADYFVRHLLGVEPRSEP
jgi:dipeptidyl-peptidase 4